MSTYQVGQILFLMSNNNVFPVQVVEEIIKTTLDGQEKTYIVLFPNKEETKSDISKLKGKLFKTKVEVRNYMINNATKAINEMVTLAEKISDEVFGYVEEENLIPEYLHPKIEKQEIELSFPTPEEVLEEETIAKMQQGNKEDIITIDLGNGQVGKINQAELNKVQQGE